MKLKIVLNNDEILEALTSWLDSCRDISLTDKSSLHWYFEDDNIILEQD